MNITPLSLPGVFVIDLAPIADERGHFVTTYAERLFSEHGLQTAWVQENESVSSRNVVRGLHFQLPPHSETKLVRVASGTILDVIVDLRKSSPGYGRWEGVELSAQNHRVLYIPKGFAHGFCALEDHTMVLYKVDEPFTPAAQAGILWNDPDLGVAWPVDNPILSAKDTLLPRLKDFANPFEFEAAPLHS